MNKGISVVIPVKNRIDDLIICIDSVQKSFQYLEKKRKEFSKWELLVVDDSSEEDINTPLKKYSFVKVISNGGVGPGAARNLGMNKAKYDYVAFIDSDCISKEDWLLRVVEDFETNKVNAIQGNPCLFMKKNNPKLGLCEEKLYLGLFKSYIDGKYCTQIDTRNCAFRKNILNELNSDIFITDMKKAQAEARVCGNNLVKKGVKILYDDKMIIYHKDPSSIKDSMRQKARHGSGRIYVWEKTPSFKYFFTRYYWNPIVKFGVPYWYVIPTHTAFIRGYFKAKRNKK